MMSRDVVDSNGQGIGPDRSGNRLIVSSTPTSARLWRRPYGVAWDAVPEPIVKHIDPDFVYHS